MSKTEIRTWHSRASQRISDSYGTKVLGEGRHKRILYSCCLCKKRFWRRSDLLNHKREDHSY